MRGVSWAPSKKAFLATRLETKERFSFANPAKGQKDKATYVKWLRRSRSAAETYVFGGEAIKLTQEGIDNL